MKNRMYTTKFDGQFAIEPPLSPKRHSYLVAFANDRHTTRGHPSLYCRWPPTLEGDALAWGNGDNFTHYIEWLEYLLVNFFTPWGYTLNGTVEWDGEESCDMGKIIVTNNNLKALQARIEYVEDDE